MTSGKVTVLYSARAHCRGTVCHTHSMRSMRSGTTLTSSYLLYQAMTAEQQLCAAFGWRQHTLSEIRDNSDKVYNTLSLTITGHDIRDSCSVLHSAGAPSMGTVCHTHSLRSGTTLTRFILYQAGTGTLHCTQLGRPVGGQLVTHSH